MEALHHCSCLPYDAYPNEDKQAVDEEFHNQLYELLHKKFSTEYFQTTLRGGSALIPRQMGHCISFRMSGRQTEMYLHQTKQI
jgi:hypothetical protein